MKKGMGGLIASPPTACLLLLLLLGFTGPALGGVLFSTLPQTLIVSASPKQGQGGRGVLKAGVDKITVLWQLNQSLPVGADGAYKKVKVQLCYAPASQTDRRWRKTNNDLHKDKTCQFTITTQPYTNRSAAAAFDHTVERDVPTAHYFVRAYALDYAGAEVAYGQTTNAKKDIDLFEITGIAGRNGAIDVAAVCFSAFSVVSLFVFFVAEKRKTKR